MSRVPGCIASRVAARYCRIVACIVALIMTQGPPQATIQTIVSRLTPGQATHERALLQRPACCQPCSRLYCSPADRVAPLVARPSMHRSAVSWPGAPACHDTKHCIMTQQQMGSSPFPVPFLHPFFFFHIIFFSSFPLLQNLPKKKKKKIYIYIYIYISNIFLISYNIFFNH